MTAGFIANSIEGAVATITLDRPDKLNALTGAMLAELAAALDAAAADPDVRVVVLTGSGRAFSSGQDLSAISPGETDLGALLEDGYKPVIMRLFEYPKVTVAALNGPALGAAANITLACDIVVAAESAFLQQTFVTIGLVPDAGGTWLLPRIVGMKRALALMLTGERVAARDAEVMGLVYRVFSDGDLAAEAAALAARLAENAPETCRLIKEALRSSQGNDLDRQLAVEASAQRDAGRTEAFRSAVEAFRQRRNAAGS